MEFSFPQEKIITTIEGAEIPALSLTKAKETIQNGIRESAPENLSKKNITIIVPDNTRLWARGDLFVPVVVNTLLEIGAAQEKINIIIALGTHQDIPKELFPKLVGENISDRITVLNSANKNKNRLVKIGTTSKGTDVTITREACEADHIIVFGGLLHHLIAGFGGGRKYFLPGIAGYDSIQRNHSLAFCADGTPHPKVLQGSLQGNPIHEDMQEAADMFLKNKSCSFVGIAINGRGEIFYAGCGELDSVFEEGCKQVNLACCASIDELADFALISAGGYRTDGQLYQSSKALFNAVHAVKPNGQILFVAEAAEGVGNQEFGKTLSQYKNKPAEIGKLLNQQFSMPAYVAYRLADLLNRFQVTLISNFNKTETEAFGFHFMDDLKDYLKNLKGNGYVIPFAENVLPVLDS